jgi:hypothetical protein
MLVGIVNPFIDLETSTSIVASFCPLALIDQIKHKTMNKVRRGYITTSYPYKLDQCNG